MILIVGHMHQEVAQASFNVFLIWCNDVLFFFFSSRRRHTRLQGDWSSDVCSSDLPTYGEMCELYVIAAVVVGGTSLQGGQGTIVGTLIGAFIIAVIHNGLNLTGVGRDRKSVV